MVSRYQQAVKEVKVVSGPEGSQQGGIAAAPSQEEPRIVISKTDSGKYNNINEYKIYGGDVDL